MNYKKINLLIIIILASIANIFGSNKETEKKDEANINKKLTEEVFSKEFLNQHLPSILPYDLQNLIAKYSYTEKWDLKKELWLGAYYISGPLVYSPSAKHLAISDNTNIKIFNTTDYSLINTLSYDQNKKIDLIAYSPNGNHLVAASNHNGTIKIWDAFNNYRLLYTLTDPDAYLTSIAYSPDNKYLAYSFSTKIKILEVNNNYRLLNTINISDKYAGNISSISFSPDGLKIASFNSDMIRIWDLINEKIEQKNEENTSYFNRFRGLFKTMFDTSLDKLFNKTNLNYKLLDQFDPNQYDITSLKYFPNKKYIASMDDFKIKIWDSQTYKLLHEIDNFYGIDTFSQFKAIDFSPNGKFFAAGSISGIINIWDAYTFNLLQTIKKEDPIISLSFSSDNSLAVASYSNAIQTDDLESRYSIGIWQYNIE